MAESKSRIPAASPRSQCGFGEKLNMAARPNAELPYCPLNPSDWERLNAGRWASISINCFSRFIELIDAFIVALDLLGNFLHARENRAGILAGLFQARDFLAGFVALRFESFVLGDELAAFGIERFEWLQIEFSAAIARHFFDGVEMFPHISEI